MKSNLMQIIRLFTHLHNDSGKDRYRERDRGREKKMATEKRDREWGEVVAVLSADLDQVRIWGSSPYAICQSLWGKAPFKFAFNCCEF